MASAADYGKYYKAALQRYGIPESTEAGLVTVESGGDPNAVSPAGARGTTQFMPGTAKSYNVQYGNSPAAIESQILGSAHYLSDLGYAKNPKLALSSYNAGPGNPSAAGPYAANVLAAARKYAYLDKGGGMSGGGLGIPAMSDTGGAQSAVRLSKVPTTPTTNVFQVLGGLEDARQAVLKNQGPDPLSSGWDQLAQLYSQQYSAQAKDENSIISSINAGISGNNDMLAGMSGNTPHGDTAVGLKAKGVGSYQGTPVANWIIPILQYAREHGWKGGVNSGYRTDAVQTQIYNSGRRPAAVPKSLGGQGSNHEGSTYPLGAVDVSEASQLSQILQNSPYRGVLVWAGKKDPVHFSHPHNGGY